MARGGRDILTFISFCGSSTHKAHLYIFKIITQKAFHGKQHSFQKEITMSTTFKCSHHEVCMIAELVEDSFWTLLTY